MIINNKEQNRTDLLDVHEALAGVQHDVQQDEPGLAVRLLPLLRRGAVVNAG